MCAPMAVQEMAVLMQALAATVTGAVVRRGSRQQLFVVQRCSE
jgi:hypothetical protein